MFEAGDYAGAARFGDPASIEALMSRALLIGDAATLDELGSCTEDEARLHHAAALWIHGHDDLASARLLELAPRDEHARNLLALLRQPRIRVLAQLPRGRGMAGRTGMLHPDVLDRRFEIRNIGYQSEGGDLPNQPYARVRGYCSDGFRPDFYLAAMVEWHHLPPDLATLPCPILGQVADYDLHVQTLRPWIDAFDELVVTDRTEWLGVQGLSRRVGAAPMVTSFPKSFGISPRATLGSTDPRRRQPRPLDFFVSGTMLDPLHPDKAQRLHELLSIEDITMRVVHGFAGADAYEGLLAASKVSFAFVRRPGATPTRALEALSMGCAVALQEESVLGLWFGEDEGVRFYGPERGSLAASVRHMLDHWDTHYEAAARRGAARVRHAFERDRVASQYLRFATFRAAAPRPLRGPVDLRDAVQKRISAERVAKAPSPVVRRRTMQANFRMLRGRADDARSIDETSPSVLNDMARELLLECAGSPDASENRRALIEDAHRLLELGVRLYPDHLVLRFNCIRAGYEFGDADARAAAATLGAESLERDPTSWEIAPIEDDVWSFDVGAEAFNYRDYLTAVTDIVTGRRDEATTKSETTRLILASIAAYLARDSERLDLHQRAVELDPAFARYRLDAARARLAVDPRDPDELARIADEFELLADGSPCFVEASELLESLRLRPDAPPPTRLSPAAIALPLRRMREQSLDVTVELRHLLEDTRASASAPPAVEPATDEDTALLAVLVPMIGSEGDLADLLVDIQGQTIAHRIEVHIALPEGGASSRAHAIVRAHRHGACGVHTVEVPLGASFGEALVACVTSAADLPFLTIASPGTRRRVDAWEILTGTMVDSRCDVVFANDGRTEGPTAAFDDARCTAISCPPPYGIRGMFATNIVGFHPVWRSDLHVTFGDFEPAFGTATEYEFWLRVAPHTDVMQRRELLTTSPIDSPWLALRDAECDGRAAQRARTHNWPKVWGPRPMGRACRPLPADLFDPALAIEATSHLRLGILPVEAAQEIEALQSLYGAALMQRDVDTAERMLRTATECHPTLLSARVLHARILESIDIGAVDKALEHVLACNPYPAAAHRVIGHTLARLGPLLENEMRTT